MVESSKFKKSWTFENQILKIAMPINIINFKFKWSIVFRYTEIKSKKPQESAYIQDFEASKSWIQE